MTPLLLSRNPWLLVQTLVIVWVVRAVWKSAMSSLSLGWFLKTAAIFGLVSVAFNVLTAHAGNQVITELPGSWLIVGGPLTWNALVYGLLGGTALFTLVLTGLTVSALISWIDLFHVIPRRLAPIAVTGSVAWAFLPQTAVAWRQIREAQTMRGHRFRGVRDFIPIIVPLMAGGLDRSLAMAEALESRGFGASPSASPRQAGGAARDAAFGFGIVTGLGGLAVAVYCLAVGLASWAMVAAAVAGLSLVVLFRLSPPSGVSRTRYRVLAWTGADSLVTATSLLALAAVVAWNGVSPASLAYSPYPDMTMPPVDLPLLLTLGLLMVPATVYRPARQAA